VEKTTKRRAKLSVLFNKHYAFYQVKNKLMGGACSTCEGQERCLQDFGGNT